MNDSRKQRKKMSLERPEPWHGPCLKWHGRAWLCWAKPSISRRLARPVPMLARPCHVPRPSFINFFYFLLLPHQTHTSLILQFLYLNLHNINLQTSISISIHHSKHKQPIKTNIHPTPLNPNPKKTTNSLPTFIIQTHKPHLNPNPITTPTFPTQNLAKP